jgi:hypothetical protein
MKRWRAASSRWLLAGLATLFFWPTGAEASCGSDMCVLDLRGPEAARGRWSVELAYSFIEQDHVRIGTDPATVGEIPGEHNEIETRSDVWTTTARTIVSERLSLAASLPWVKRFHAHEEEHHEGAGFYETHTWDYEGLGDVLVSSYLTPDGFLDGETWSTSLMLGIKAPTGKEEVEAVDGHQPEPMARPGTGSWDGMVGFQVRRPLITTTFSGEAIPIPLSFSVTGRVNGTGTEDYKIGNEVVGNLAGGWGLASNVVFLGQINARFRAKDEEAGATAENTGGTAWYATPGLSVSTGPVGVYGYWQFRLYENVNGIQITAPSHLMFGVNYSL